MAEELAPQRFLWEDFELDVRLRRVSRGGRRIRLQPMPFQVLLLLLEHPGEVVTRDDLHHKIWNGYAYGDFDHSLNIAISKLREALGDSAAEPRYVETLPRIGYRFLVPVRTNEEATGSAQTPATAHVAATPWHRVLARAPAFAVLATLTLTAGALWVGARLLRQGSDPSFSAVNPNRSGLPEGRVAYVAPKEGSGPFRFTGSGGEHVRVPNNPLLEPKEVSVDAWVRAVESPGKFRYILAKGADLCSGASYAIYTGTNGGVAFYVGGGTAAVPLVSPPASPSIWNGKWRHVAGTFDGETVRLFVDGVEVGHGFPNTSSVKVSYDLPTNSDLSIGDFSGTCSAPFKGDIGQVQVFNRALSQTEISSLYQARVARFQDVAQPPPPRAISTACAPVPNGLVGTWTGEQEGVQEQVAGVPSFQVGSVNRGAGKVGIGIQFLGDGHLEYRSAPHLNLTGPLTVEGWVYYTGFNVTPAGGSVIVGKWADPASAQASYGLFLRPNGVPYFALSSEGVSATRVEAPLPLVVELTHLAGVWDGKRMRLYANGVQVAEAPFAGPLHAGAGPLCLGGRINKSTGRHEAMSGMLDEIAVYGRALSEEEIESIYKAGSAGKCLSRVLGGAN